MIQQELRANEHWTGQLIHVRRDGSRVTVGNWLDLKQNPYSQDRGNTVIETNGPLPVPRSGDFWNEVHSFFYPPRCSNGAPPCQKVS